MNRRRVFALLWAFCLMTGASGMTVLAEETYVSRIVSFTDCTGMRVTYDANACRQYVYEVENGVLTGVKVEKTDEEGNAILETGKFEGTVELQQPEEGDKYTSIAADLFQGNQDITYVKLPAGVTTITAESFRGCTALKSVYLPSTVKTIEKEAFRDCTAMTQIALPKSVTSVGEEAFKGDKKLQLVYFRSGGTDEVHAIWENAFPNTEEAKDLVITAEKGSIAEIYARRNGIPFEEIEPEE
ncbi:MAG: leucine-rich repeat domain-containing protein [Lachnospiraceae bacterium]|nr:leucine-rich repeat domain-containing protein [Lachnospiraceae bacterium]